MNILDIIYKKQCKEVLSKEEIEYVVSGYTNGLIPDYQMSAFLMAVYFVGMTEEETTMLTLAMRDSGDVVKLGDVKGYKVDKHSTGGVGDKTTLVLGPMLAALGITFAKMSGRGLGHTGGTIDKLEAIPGFNTQLPIDKFKENLNKIGIAVVGQTGNLAPADKKIYALRDVTSTVASIPLIASSIMSKKLASGANSICLDVKVGEGAFMKNIDDAKRLASLMVKIGKNAGKTMSAILTDMSSPLGNAIGNTLEVIEAIETLKGGGPKDLEDLCSNIAAILLMDANKVENFEDGYRMANETLHNQEAFKKFEEMVEYQGGDVSYIVNPNKFEESIYQKNILSEEEGYIKGIDAFKLGEAALRLGAGREELGAPIDFSVGIKLIRKPGDFVKKGDVLAVIYHNEKGINEAKKLLAGAYSYSKEEVKTKLILDIIR